MEELWQPWLFGMWQRILILDLALMWICVECLSLYTNLRTDVALDSKSNTIEIDLIEAIGESKIPEKVVAHKGAIM